MKPYFNISNLLDGYNALLAGWTLLLAGIFGALGEDSAELPYGKAHPVIPGDILQLFPGGQAMEPEFAVLPEIVHRHAIGCAVRSRGGLRVSWRTPSYDAA